MADSAEDLINELLVGTMEELDAPPDVEQMMHDVYADIGDWMGDALGEGQWTVFPQGSARLGTIVRPPDGGDFDLDAVVMKHVDKHDTTKDRLKSDVGDALDLYLKERSSAPVATPTGCDESRRCWTLSFVEPFHMDFLPAVPNHDRGSSPTRIWIPDRDLREWQPSDPIAYADWFLNLMAAELIEKRAAFALKASVDVEDVPQWRVRTTLQRTVQVLKAHRNLYFEPGDTLLPPSIILTTLAARAYRGEDRLFDGVMNCAARMGSLVERDGPLYVVANPVHEQENFADMWTPAAAQRFFDWLDDLQRTLESAAGTRDGLHGAATILKSAFGTQPVTASTRRFAEARNSAVNTSLKVTATGAVGSSGLAVKRNTFHGR